MATVFFNYCINMLSKQFVCLQNKFLRHFISFLLNSCLKRHQYLYGKLHLFCFLKRPIQDNQEDWVWA